MDLKPKSETVKPLKCETCLSDNRRLVCLPEIRAIIEEVQLAQMLSPNGGICWECQYKILNFYKFRLQVKQAQEALSRSVQEQQLKSLSVLANITKENYDFEFTYFCDPLLSAVETREIKAEPKIMKIEKEDLDFDKKIHSDTDYDVPLSIFADSIKIKNVKKQKRLRKKRSLKQNKEKRKDNLLKKKKVNLIKEPQSMKINLKMEQKKMKYHSKKEQQFQDKSHEKKILKEKFETIVFTEEEMIKCREEKRNQANYKKIPFKCSSCVTGFTKKENFELHQKKLHDKSMVEYKCPVCEARFNSKAAGTRHYNKHYTQYKCRLCHYKVSSARAAVAHGRDKHTNDEEGNIHCKQCVFIARTSTELSEHVGSAHTLFCNECGVPFKGRNTLRAHKIRIHSTIREFSCATCRKTFTSASRLQCHAARHAARHAAATYCVPCRRHYSDIHVYRNHLRNHRNHVQDRISCPECDKKFASRVYRNKHYNFYHLRRSRYKCEDCDKLFISDWRLKIHKQTHHGLARSRDHACALCEKKFYTKATLLTHSLLHAASRAFMCALCGATFRQRAALYTHAKLLHRDAAS